jgi:preprotein translocase subunit SecG
MLFKVYRYFYYRNYAWYLRKWGESDLPQYNAMFVVAFLFFINLLNLRIAIEFMLGYRLFESSGKDGPYVIAVLAAVLLIHYFLLVQNGKYRKIAKEFRNESPTQEFFANVVYERTLRRRFSEPPLVVRL